MSMNLNCNHIDLWPTSTHITHICLMDHNGIQPNATGKEAIRALRCYLEWAGTLLPYPVCNNDGEALENDWFRETLQEHRKAVEALFDLEDLQVWLM